MSRLWKSELRVRLGARGCTLLHLQDGGCLHARGRPAQALPQLLRAWQLRAGPGERPRSAPPVQLLLTEELAYLDLLPASVPWTRRDALARERFAAGVGAAELQVNTALLPGGRHWLAAAVESSALRHWARLLGEAGHALGTVALALPHDLQAPQGAGLPPEAVLGLVRHEGLLLVQLRAGQPRQLAWERCDTRQVAQMAARVRAAQWHHGAGAAPPVWLHAPDLAATFDWTEAVRAQGWQLVTAPRLDVLEPVLEPAAATANVPTSSAAAGARALEVAA